jgi:hypothetical protein
MKKKWHLLIVSGLLLIYFLLGLDTIFHLSPTYDEPLHLASGYSYLRTANYYLNIYDHPPFAEMLAALPLIFMKPVLLTQHPSWMNYQQYSFANLFLYHNRIDAERMLNTGRIMILLLSCLLGFMVYLWAGELYGKTCGIFGLVLYTFSSIFLAHGTLVTTDLAFTFFYFLSIYSFWRWTKRPGIKNILFMAVCFGLALASKFSAIIIVGVYGVILLYVIFAKEVKLSKAKFIGQILIFLLAAVIVVFLVYRFNSLGLYFEGLKRTLLRLDKGRSAFLAGNYSTVGWKHYFLFVFLIKTSIPVLLFLLLSFVNSRGVIYHARFGKVNNMMFLLIPAVLYFIIASFSKVQIGQRHIMPVYPFLIVWVSGVASDIKKKTTSKTNYLVVTGCLLLVIWHIFSCLKIHPWHISYFNEFAGKSGYKYLTDSNIDWGQGLKEMGKWFKRQKIKGVHFCYFGTGDPHYYGVRYIPVGFIDNLTVEERAGDDITFLDDDIFFAISVTNLQATYYAGKDVFKWLKVYEPDKIIADSIFIYNLTDKPEALNQLSAIGSR